MWATLAALGVLCVAAAADGFVRHGYSVSWYATSTRGERIETTRTTEHRVVIPNDHRPMARMVEGWNFARLGVPVDVPPIDATLRARLRVPAGGRYLHVTTTGETHIRVDGSDIDAQTLVGAGPHRVEIDWRTPIDPNTYFRLEWGPATDATEPVPREAISPADTVFPPMRLALWGCAWALAFFVFFVALRLPRTSELARQRWVHALLVLTLVCTGLGFRLIDYSVTPDWRDNDDERFACWNGYFLLTEGRPRALTIWPAEYVGLVDMSVHPYFGRVFHLITPYFEHPPLMHVLVGAACGVCARHRPARAAVPPTNRPSSLRFRVSATGRAGRAPSACSSPSSRAAMWTSVTKGRAASWISTASQAVSSAASPARTESARSAPP